MKLATLDNGARDGRLVVVSSRPQASGRRRRGGTDISFGARALVLGRT
jgi:Fumarylacetoacetase N-terminal domain 2